MVETQQGLKPAEKKGFWERMGMGQKLLIGVGFVLIIVVIIAMVMGGIDNFYQFLDRKSVV